MIKWAHGQLTTVDQHLKDEDAGYQLAQQFVSAANLTLETVDHSTASSYPAVPGASDTVGVTVPAEPMFACVPAADHEDRTASVHHILASAVEMLGSAIAVEV